MKISVGGGSGYCEECGRWRNSLIIIREDFCGSRFVYGERWCVDCEANFYFLKLKYKTKKITHRNK